MRLFKILLAFTLLISLSETVQAQYYYYNDKYYDKDWVFEFGGSIGGMNSITDVGGPKGKGGLYINDMNLKYTQAAGGIYVGALYRQLAGARIEITRGSVRSADEVLKGASGGAAERYNRNLAFFSTISEVAVIGEFHPLGLRNAETAPLVSPYIMAGLGWFKFNPQISMNGRYVDLRPLKTEGQGMAEYKDRNIYHLSQANVPFGFGLKYELNELFTIRGEVLHRFLFTDYLDDVSKTYIDPALFDKYLAPMQAAEANAVYKRKKLTPVVPGEERGNASNNDSYVTFSVKIGITLGREKRR
jgi:hypothetical protein